MASRSVATPAQGEAFALDNYFNSTSTDPVETPIGRNGLQPPSNWGQGLRAWRREWRAWNPNWGPPNPFWSPGLRKLVVRGNSALNSNYYQAAGQVFTINGWDLQGPSSGPASSTVSNLFVQIAAYYMNGAAQVFIEPSTLFASYDWGLYGASTQVTFPSKGSANFVQLSQAATTPVPSIVIGGAGRTYQAGPNTQQEMNVGPLVSLLFNSTITPPQGVSLIKLQIAVYMSLTPTGGSAVQCFDDPEMDVDMGSNK